MTAFWIVAGLLCVLAATILFVPTLLRRRKAGAGWSITGIAAALATPLLALAIYSAVTTYDPELASLSSEEWAAMGRERFLAEDYESARIAYMTAFERTPVPSNELKLGLAESLIFTEPESLTAEAGMLVEDVLSAEPDNMRALFYGALGATQRGELANARDRWSRMLAFELPPEIEKIVREQMAALSAGGAADAGAAAALDDETQPVPAAGESIRVRVSLGEGRSMPALGPQARLFVSARAAQGGGPPVAALQLAPSAVPGEFTLSDANSLMGRALSSVDAVVVTARLSANGDALGQPGDLYAEPVTARVGSDEVVELVIDSVAQ